MPLFYQPVISAGVSGGNTVGNTGLEQGSIAFAGGNNITLSQATNATGASITVSGAPGDSIGISTQGNTAGTTGFFSQSYQLVGSNLITLSQSTAVGQGTLTIVGPRVPSIVRFNNMPVQGSVSNQTNSPYVTLGTVNGSMQIFPLTPAGDLFPGNMTASTLFVDMSASHTNTSATTQAQTLRFSVGIYTLAGASTLSLLNSGSGSITAPATSNQSTLWHGARYLTLNSSAFSAALTFSQTSYWMGIIMSSSGTTNSAFGYLGVYQGNQGVIRSGTMGVSGTSNNSRDWQPWGGVVGTAVLPASIHISGITKSGASGGFIPHVIMENLHSAW
jgi:hypothetical protein